MHFVALRLFLAKVFRKDGEIRCNLLKSYTEIDVSVFEAVRFDRQNFCAINIVHSFSL